MKEKMLLRWAHIFRKTSFFSNAFILLCLCICAFALYGETLNKGFLWDDYHFVVNNINIRGFQYIGRIFTQTVASGSFTSYYFYRPVQQMTYLLDYQLWGLNPFGYHFVNIVLHGIVAFMVFLVLKQLIKDSLAALVTSLIFLFHPVYSDTVMNISGRAGILVTFFFYLSFMVYLRWIKSKKSVYGILLCLTALLAFFSKENGLMLLAVCGAYNLLFLRKIGLRNLAPILCSTILYLGFRFAFLNTQGDLVSRLAEWPARVPGFFYAFVQYLRLMIWPSDLHFDYGQPVFLFNNPVVLLGFAVYVFVICWGIMMRKTQPIITFAILWFLILLIPVSNIFKHYSFMLENYLYLPSFGLLILYAFLIKKCFKISNRKRLILLSQIFIIIIFSFLTLQQNWMRSSPITFYSRIIKFNPQSFDAFNNLGNEYARYGKYQDAIVCFQKALKLRPHDWRAHRNLGLTLLDLGQKNLARKHLKSAYGLKPNNIKVINAYAIILFEVGEIPAAIEMLHHALKLEPDYSATYVNLAIVYSNMGKRDVALKYANQALKLNPYNTKALSLVNLPFK